MIIVYRGFGLVWILLGGLLAFILLALTQSLTVAAAGTAALWIWRGRGRINPETQERLPSPSVYFIPVWFYGAALVPASVIFLIVELNSGRVLSTTGDREQAIAEASGLTIDDQSVSDDGTPRIRMIDESTGEITTIKVPQRNQSDDAASSIADRASSEPASQTPSPSAPENATDTQPQETVASARPTDGPDSAGPSNARSPTTSPQSSTEPRRPVDPQQHIADVKARLEAARAARQNRSRSRSSVPATSADSNASPGDPVTAETVLRPGQKLAASWARKWYQVVVVGIDNRGVHVDWVGSNAWRNNRVRPDTLRVVSDEEFAECLQYGKDEPLLPGEVLASDEKPSASFLYLCEASGSWIPVRVLSTPDDGSIEVDWLRFDATQNGTIPVERLRKFSSDSSSRQQLMAIHHMLTFSERRKPTVGAVAMSTSRRQSEQPGQLWEIIAVEDTTCRVIPVGGKPSEAVEVSAASLRVLPEDL